MVIDDKTHHFTQLPYLDGYTKQVFASDTQHITVIEIKLNQGYISKVAPMPHETFNKLKSILSSDLFIALRGTSIKTALVTGAHTKADDHSLLLEFDTRNTTIYSDEVADTASKVVAKLMSELEDIRAELIPEGHGSW